MSQNEQNQFINRMIERLSSKLQEQPDNFDGWLKLAQSYLLVDKPNQADNVLISATYAINSDEERISLIEFALLSHPSSSSTALAGAQLSMLPISLKKHIQ